MFILYSKFIHNSTNNLDVILNSVKDLLHFVILNVVKDLLHFVILNAVKNLMKTAEPSPAVIITALFSIRVIIHE